MFCRMANTGKKSWPERRGLRFQLFGCQSLVVGTVNPKAPLEFWAMFPREIPKFMSESGNRVDSLCALHVSSSLTAPLPCPPVQVKAHVRARRRDLAAGALSRLYPLEDLGVG